MNESFIEILVYSQHSTTLILCQNFVIFIDTYVPICNFLTDFVLIVIFGLYSRPLIGASVTLPI